MKVTSLLFSPGKMHRILNEGKIGSSKIVQDSPDMLTRLRAARDGQPLNEEKYTRLLINGTVWMTDAEFEWRTNLEAVSRLTGNVLVAGLGIGFMILPILDKGASVTVIENNKDVISLVVPQIKNERMNVIHADAKTWDAPRRAFDHAYLDIWANVPNSDDLLEIRELKKKYRRAVKPGGWLSAWCERYATRA